MKVLCLLDNVVKPGNRWLWKYLPSNNDELDFLVTTTAVDQFQKWGKLLNYYPAFWQTGFRALLKTRQTHYDLVVAWQGKSGFPYAVLRSIVGQTSPPLIILGFSLQGVVSHFLGLVRFGLRSVSRVTVLTPVEVEFYRQRLSLSPEAICYTPLGWYDTVQRYETPEVRKSVEALAQAGKFIYTFGRSYRDYGTLARAVEGTELNVKLSGRAFNLAGIKLPHNIETTGWLNYRELEDHLYKSQFCVVPLQPIAHSSGETSLLHAMSFGKAVVATRSPGTETYIQHGLTGLLVEPGDVQAMRQALLHLWRNPDVAAQMGKEGRRRFEEDHTMAKFAQRTYDVAQEVYRAQCA
jgi:glycosyltransferase involved in cell wall biosynthesis